ncbi:MAG: ABC transporter ATP-binding protein [Desulfobacteraceae bacterium]|nr:ABC transporter ATP-binding protein [Desulfobacteraceae bacterium]
MAPSAASFLVLKNIRKSYGDHAIIKGLNAEIEKGELVSFIGPSGCGKSTLLRSIAGFTKLDSGQIILDGKIVNDDVPHKRGTGMVFQNYALFPHLSVESNVGYGLKILGQSKAQIRDRVEELLGLVHLPGLGKRRIDQLSGGQQQRVALARALSLNPKILLLDEPLSNLDANLRVTMRAEIKRIQKQLGLTVIFVTHDREEAMSISSRVMIMTGGLVEQLGSPTEIYDRPATEFIAGFVGHVNPLEGNVQSVNGTQGIIRVSTQLGPLEVFSNGGDFQTGEAVKLIVRPEHITICASQSPAGCTGKAPDGNGQLVGQVIDAMYTGSIVKYNVSIGESKLIVEQYNPRECGVFSDGQRISMKISRDVHILRKGEAA